jgi:hypothetical protein
MRLPGSPRPFSVALLIVPATFAAVSALAGDEVTASRSLTVQAAGARGGKSGELYFNVEGRRNGNGGKYASFGVLALPSKGFEGNNIKIEGLTLTPVQSIALFSKDGKAKFYLATGEFDAGGLTTRTPR